MVSSASSRIKFVAALCLFLIMALGGWEAWRIWNPGTAAPPVAPPAAPALPFVQESRPAPPPIPLKRPLPAPLKKAPALKPSPKPHVPVPAAKPAAAPPLPPPAAVVPAAQEPLEWQGNDTSVTHAGQAVVHNDRQWIHFWSEHHPHEAAPEVDFSKYMVLGVFAGPRPAEQFTIRMINFQTLPGSLVVDYRERLPPPGTFAVNVTVYPYHLKAIPRSTLPVKFNALPPENVVR